MVAACAAAMMPFALGVRGVASAAAAQSLDVRLQVAVQKLEGGDGLGALLDLEAILSRDDEYWPAYYWRGRVQAQLGDDLGAKESFLRAADLDPGNPELHFLAASVAWQLADFAAAWGHVISAAQAGYPDAPVQALMKNLRGYQAAPADLQDRLWAPRLVVEAPVEGPIPEHLVLELRQLLARTSTLALVQSPELAAYRVRLEIADSSAADASGVADTFLVLTRAGDNEELLRTPVTAGNARSALEDAVAAVQEIVRS